MPVLPGFYLNSGRIADEALRTPHRHSRVSGNPERYFLIMPQSWQTTAGFPLAREGRSIQMDGCYMPFAGKFLKNRFDNSEMR